MRKVPLLIALCLLFTLTTHSQTTTIVTGTITDAYGVPYSGATVLIELTPALPAGTITGTLPAGFTCCVPVATQTDKNGAFSILLGSNAAMQAGKQWKFTVTAPGIAAPMGTGAQTFTVTITISGASQDVSATLTASAPKLTNGGGIIIAGTQVAFGSATNTIAGSANFTWDNTAKSLAVTNSGLSGIAPIYALALGVTTNEAGLVAQCQQLGNFFCEAGQFAASDSGTGPIGSVIGIALASSHTAAGTLATFTGLDLTPTVGNGAGAITTSRGIHVAGITFPTGTSPTTHDGIKIDDQCAGSFPATTCIGLNVATQSNSSPGVQSPSVALVSTTVSALPTAATGNKGQMRSVSDSTAVAAEGQTCVGGNSNTALAFSNGTVWKCF